MISQNYPREAVILGCKFRGKSRHVTVYLAIVRDPHLEIRRTRGSFFVVAKHAHTFTKSATRC